MFNIVSVLIGLVALLMALFSFIPLLGWGNWFVLPVAIVGLVIGLFSRSNAGRMLNLLVIGVAIFRLIMGGGIF